MINIPDLSSKINVYMKPQETYNPRMIDRLAYVFSYLGKGVLEGFEVDANVASITINPGILIADNRIIKLIDSISITLHASYFGTLPNIYALIYYYKYEVNNPDDVGYFDFKSTTDIDMNDVNTVVLYFFDIHVTP